MNRQFILNSELAIGESVRFILMPDNKGTVAAVKSDPVEGIAGPPLAVYLLLPAQKRRSEVPI
ncbi:MAG: hypothetical protein IPH75_12500 [bacterium]|nr:hypothetical protein [bacterium]